MNKAYILVIDEGTTGVRALIYDRNMAIKDYVYEKLDLLYPIPDAAECSAEEIYDKIVKTCREVVKKCGISPEEIAAVSITSQRSTWVMWDKTTGRPLHNASLWFDNRGRYQLPALRENAAFHEAFPGVIDFIPTFYVPLVAEKIGVDDPTFAEAMKKESTLFGNMDAWLIWKLTDGAVHATTNSMLSASMIYDNAALRYNFPLIGFFGFREEMLPEVRDEISNFGVMSADILGVEIPICAAFADQQSAMFSQGCLKENTVKCTLGTGAFMDIHVGGKIKSAPGFNPMITWKIGDDIGYLLEGQSSTAGTCLEWAKNKLELFKEFSEMDDIAQSVIDSNGVYFIPALAGLVAPPYNDTSAKGAFMGMNPETTRAHLVRALLEGVAFAAACMMEESQKSGITIEEIKMSGGVSKSATVLQTIADVMDASVIRPKSVEATAMGAAEAAAITLGWMTMDDIEKHLDIDKCYTPGKNRVRVKKSFANWKSIVGRALDWQWDSQD